MKKKPSKSLRVFIRKEKAKIRKENLELNKQKELIKILYEKSKLINVN